MLLNFIMNSASNVAEVFLITIWYHATETRYILYICVCLRLALFVLFIWYNFLYDLYFHYKHSLKQTHFCFGQVRLTFSLRVLLSFCLIFCQFQPGVAYKSGVYKKACRPVSMLNTEATPDDLYEFFYCSQNGYILENVWVEFKRSLIQQTGQCLWPKTCYACALCWVMLNKLKVPSE